jgi:transcriptional regulator with XRE-family HTH domain
MTANERLQALRVEAGKTHAEMAVAGGINVAHYYDLEDHESDLYMTVSLAELRGIANALGTSVGRLLGVSSADAPESPSDFQNLATVLREHLVRENLDRSAFEDKAGWEVGDFLGNPASALTNWNVDCLRDICQQLSVDWRSWL